MSEYPMAMSLYAKVAFGLPAAKAATANIHDIRAAYHAMATNGDHPDHGGNAERWTLITAAFNECKSIAAKKRGALVRKSDQAWVRHWGEMLTSLDDGKPEPGSFMAQKAKTGPKPKGSERCGHATKSGPCIRVMNHPHSHMSQSNYDTKRQNAAAKKASK